MLISAFTKALLKEHPFLEIGSFYDSTRVKELSFKFLDPFSRSPSLGVALLASLA